ncbi:hypothetical protein EDD66_103215 [Mobilisporobacter senegalensis]|uniref:Uncharacterized protein n=1 Tax=Mobilisporobacter senegalensis TaxID=1329262 RepID=A0A3N1XRI1_9FIRM|nr:hypothetical protein [Mobilisporobacter senegalensis]ROR29279.1 hypothetical protein EDD66_103215 [Mobilisporobacter senegalensis]
MLGILKGIFKTNSQQNIEVEMDEDNLLDFYKKKSLPDDKLKELVKTSSNLNYEYDPIDSDIYRCFIAYQYGISNNVNVSTKFQKIEDRISNICSAKGGKYYRTPAKSAKFAIIFNSKDINYNSIKGLIDEGYKVTTFENALKYFKLDHLWDMNSTKKY